MTDNDLRRLIERELGRYYPDTATGKDLDDLMGLTGTPQADDRCARCGASFIRHNHGMCVDMGGVFEARRLDTTLPPAPRIGWKTILDRADIHAHRGNPAHTAMAMAVAEVVNTELEHLHQIVKEQGKKIELLLRELGVVASALAEVLPKKTPSRDPRPSVAKCYCGTTVVFQEQADAQLCSVCGKVHCR